MKIEERIERLEMLVYELERVQNAEQYILDAIPGEIQALNRTIQLLKQGVIENG